MRFFAGVLFCISVVFAGAAWADDVTPNDRVTSYVVIRSEPNTQSDRLGILRPSDTAELIGDAPGWHQVRLEDGRTGFVSKRWTDVVDTPEGPEGPGQPEGPLAVSSQMFVHFVFVGQGAGAILEFPCGVAVIDTGGQWAGATDGEILFNRYLDRFFAARPQYNNTIDVLFTTHAHSDHLNGLPLLLTNGVPRYRVRNVVDNGQSAMTGPRAKQRVFRQAVIDAGGAYFAAEIRPSFTPAGMTNGVVDPIDCSAQGVDPVITVYWGGWEASVVRDLGGRGVDHGEPNNHSLVIRVDFGEASFLFTGDLEASSIEDMLRLYQSNLSAFDVDVYEVGHHGSLNATTDPLLEAMTPEVAVISAGNRTDTGSSTARDFGHPRIGALRLMTEAPGVVSGTRTPQTFWAYEEQDVDPIPYRVERAIYSTAWDGDLVLRATSSGAFEFVH